MTEIHTQHAITSILFTEDGKQMVGGGDEGMLRRWQVDDGQEVGEPIRTEGAEIYATAQSPDRRWLVCGLRTPNGTEVTARVAVWNAQTREKVLGIQGHTETVFSVDVSPDSTTFATGGSDEMAFIWRMPTGERLVGPLKHDGWVVAVRFSPDGNRIATATAEHGLNPKSIRIYNSDNGHRLLDIPFLFDVTISSWLAWSPVDGRQLYAASSGEADCFDTSTGALLSKWTTPPGWPASIVLSRNGKFAIVSTFDSLSFWDTSTHTEIGTAIKQRSTIWSIALSSNDNCIAIGEDNGTVTVRSLRGILPCSYFVVDVSNPDHREFWHDLHPLSPCILPYMYLSDVVFKSWTRGDFTRVEELMDQDIIRPWSTCHRARALAHRALVRTRSNEWDMAMDDAKKSVEIEPSVIGYIAYAIAFSGCGQHESAMDMFDMVFMVGPPGGIAFFLLIKAIILFKYGKHDHAIARVDRLIDFMVGDELPCVIVRAQMLLLLGITSMKTDNKRAIELFKRAKAAVPVGQGSQNPQLVVISLLFGWDFDRLAAEIQSHMVKALYTIVETLGEARLPSEMIMDWDTDIVQQCVAMFESSGDEAVRSNDPKRAIAQYSAALLLNPLKPADLLVKRSTARYILCLWEDALNDADKAIKTDPSSPWGYERKYAALHSLLQHDEAMNTFAHMLSLIEGSVDHELAKKCVAPPQLDTIINNAVYRVFGISPLVLIDVKSGRLCDMPERLHIFKSEPQCKELIFSRTEDLDNKRIQRVVERYFRYAMFSHVWQGREPTFQDVERAGSVWELDSSPLNGKLQKFCEVVRSDGYRWAWSDTCCIDKTISTVLNQSLKMMYRWYEASAATYVLLVDVTSPSAVGSLTHSIWMMRAWTSQELLAPKVIRFYARDWEPYLGDTRSNHKESPEIMQELADAIHVTRETINAFNPKDLTVREKLRLASTRDATVEEDIAYSLIGIFQSDIRPDYGEQEAALGHLLEEIVARSGEVTVLSWTGRSSSYNSCLPAALGVYNQPPGSPPAISNAEMDARIAALEIPQSKTDVIHIHDQVNRLPPARFANRRLHLPCIIFTVRRLGIQSSASDLENCYCAKVSGIGNVEFRTLDRLPLTEPRKLILVHPWIRELRDPLDGFTWGSTVDDDDESDSEIGPDSTPLHAQPAATMDEFTRALRLIVRLQQPFHALLLQQQPDGEFKRVAADHEIVVRGIQMSVNFAKKVRTRVVEIL